MGRTGKLFAYEHYGIEPDIFTLAKGSAAGSRSARCWLKRSLAEAFSAGSHGSTFGGTPIATAAVNATLETIVGRISYRSAQLKLGEYLMDQLQEKLAGNPFVKTFAAKVC